MRTMSRTAEWLGITMSAMLVLVACEDPPQQTKTTEQPAAPSKPRAAQGQACQSNQDCGDGLGCSPEKVCETFQTIECRSRNEVCKGEGRCTGSGSKCIAATDAECKAASICANDGRCTAKDGKCVAASSQDCADVCGKNGRCTIEDGNCIAATSKDCRDSLACKQADRCIAKLGRCISNK
jgi:hypothetical protein